MIQHYNKYKPTVKFCKFSVKVWGCVSSRDIRELHIFNGEITKEYYKDFLKKKLTRSVIGFEFADPDDPIIQLQ